MKKIGLIGAMDSEIVTFRELFSADETSVPGILRGKCDDKELYICRSGVGKVNAAIAAQRLVDLFSVDSLINSGVAGGVAPGLSKMDIVISDRLTYHDFSPAELLESYPPHCRYIKADPTLIQKAKEACNRLNRLLCEKSKPTFTAHVGTVVSGDCFVSSAEKAEQLHREFGALCTEMEGASIAHVARVNNLPFVVIRAISDFADEEAEDSFDSFEQVAARRAAYIVKEIIA